MSEPGAGLDPEIQRMVLEMLPQARSEAWKVYQAAPHALDLDDLVSLAFQGLVQASHRWGSYCAERGFSSGCGQVPCAQPETCGTRYFAAYSLRRIRGAMMDAIRSSDWVTRSMRARAKILREAGADLGRTETQLSEATGLSVRQIRATAAGLAGRPVSFDAETHDVPDAGDVGEQVVVSGVLEAVLQVMDTFDEQTRVILALRYHLDFDFSQIAELLGISEQRVTTLHNAGVLKIHDVMLRSVT